MSGQNQFLLYTAPDGAVKVEVFFKDETVWLTQKALAELFGVEVPAINKHLKNIFESGELVGGFSYFHFGNNCRPTAKNYSRPDEFYNLDAIIAVGYRVNSYQATQFRIWATKTLREFIIKGFVLDDERLKQGKQVFGKDYFDELLERIREIRASERRFYQKITDIYALSVDYNADAPLTKEFFATVQNKLHWAITGQTAAELIYASADATKIYMGLTTWKHAPHGKILKSDVTVAKNYLSEAHVKELNRIVSAYLDLAENRAAARHPDEDGRLGEIPERFPGAVELPDSAGQGQGERAGGEAQGRGRIRGLPQAAGRGIHLGLRPGNQTHRGQETMSQPITESVVEEAALEWLEGMGYSILYGPTLAVGEPAAERSDPNYRDVILEQRLP